MSKCVTPERASTGIEGFDRLVGGGLPRRRLTLITGGPGAGKTVLGLQALCHAANQGESAVMVTFEESANEAVDNHANFDWNIRSLAGNRLHILEAPVDDAFAHAGDFDIAGLLASVGEQARHAGATWVMLDGMDSLLGALEDQPAALREFYRLRRWVADCGVTCLITGKDTRTGGSGPFDFMAYAVDCVISLESQVRNRTFIRHLRALKNRGGPSAGAPVPFIINHRGINVALRESIRLEYAENLSERVGTGIARLDTLIGGGYLRGSSILISGAPGTAKTTLAASFAEYGVGSSEPVLFVSFDEVGEQVVRNMRSVGIDLAPAVKSGLLRVVGYRATSTSAEEHCIEIQRLLQELRPRYLIIDPISALYKAGGADLAADVAERLLDLAKASGITVLMTSLLEDLENDQEGTESHVSTIADTWISLSYQVRGGERNRALTIIKARGTTHSNQVRELVLSSGGATLADVYTAGGDVLMGTARLERESLERKETVHRDIEFQLHSERLEGEIRETEERINTLRRSLESYRRQQELMTHEHNELDVLRRQREARVSANRHADAQQLANNFQGGSENGQPQGSKR